MKCRLLAVALAALATGLAAPSWAQSDPGAYAPGTGYGPPPGASSGPPPGTPYPPPSGAAMTPPPGYAPPSGASSGPPPLPALSPEQSANLNNEMTRYRQWVDDRVSRGEITPDEAQRLVEWRRWQLARQIAGLAAPEPARVVVRREVYRDPYYYGPPPYYYGPPAYYGPRVSVCAGGFGHHSFGSVCF